MTVLVQFDVLKVNRMGYRVMIERASIQFHIKGA